VLYVACYQHRTCSKYLYKNKHIFSLYTSINKIISETYCAYIERYSYFAKRLLRYSYSIICHFVNSMEKCVFLFTSNWCCALFSVKCSVGYFHDIDGNTCSACARGFYQDEPKQSTCKQCPTGKTTKTTGANSAAQCEGSVFADFDRILPSNNDLFLKWHLNWMTRQLIHKIIMIMNLEHAICLSCESSEGEMIKIFHNKSSKM
jgi:hypothetical protein